LGFASFYCGVSTSRIPLTLTHTHKHPHHVPDLPYVGFVTIKLTDYPSLKYALVAVMGLFVLTTKE
jgi:hypothetical protein